MYRAYPPATDVVLRPVLEVGVVGPDDEVTAAALVDTGSENVLAAPGIARAVGAIPRHETQIELGIGGRSREVRFADVQLRLLPPKGIQSPPVEWTAEVGFFTQWEPPWSLVLGQRGFFDQFTVTIHRGARAVAVEDFEAFDDRFGTLI